MSSLQLVPFIFFKGNCQEAMEFYQKALGGELKLVTYQETIGDKATIEEKEQISYAELVSDKMVLKAFDSKIANPEARKVELMVSGTKVDEEELQRIFASLAVGGHIKQEITKQERGNEQGRLYDAFGIDWIVSIE